MSCKPRIQNKLISCLGISIGGGLVFAGLNVYKGNEVFYSKFVMPTVHSLVDAEVAHRLGIYLAKMGFCPNFGDADVNLPVLRTTLWGLQLNNPIGLAAGFDKNGEAVKGLANYGFGFVEVGSVTPRPQPGNPRPRVFRLSEDKAVINRYGFNSDGHDAVVTNLKEQFPEKDPNIVIGMNLGKNKESKSASDDYAEGLLKFKDIEAVDYFVVNISSPNTPGLRGLQNKAELRQLLQDVLKVKHDNKIKKPLLVKIAPDLNEGEKTDIAEVLLKTKVSNCMVDGLIVSNTTVSRPDSLKSSADLRTETGGLSGAPLTNLSTETIKDMYRLMKGVIPIVGVGGVSSGKDAYEKIKAGASAIQIYSVIVYEGPPVVNKIKRELANLLSADGFSNVAQAVGTGS